MRLLTALFLSFFMACGAPALAQYVPPTPTFGQLTDTNNVAIIPLTNAMGSCKVTAQTGSTFGGGTITATLSGDNGVTYAGVSGQADPGNPVTPVSTLTAVGSITVPVVAGTNLKLTLSGSTGAKIGWAVFCSTQVAKTFGTAPNVLTSKQIISSGSTPSLSLMSNGDVLSSETTVKGRYWAGQAASSAASAVVYIALTELQSANSLGPQAGDVLTITVNGHAVSYTVQAGDTTMATLATNVAAAITADSTDNAIITAVGSTSGTLGLITLTAKTAGICCRYSLSSSVSAGSQETLNSFPLLDVAGTYLDYGKNVSGWSLSTDLGAYTFDHNGKVVGPPGHTLDINNGPGAASGITFNRNNPGAYTGITIYNGDNNINHADIYYPANVGIHFGPWEQYICSYTANNCTSLPTNPGYTGEWLNVNGSTTGPTQREISASCAATTLCTINWGVPWTSATSYHCTVSGEGALDDAHIVPSSQTASQIQFAGANSVILDFICSGI